MLTIRVLNSASVYLTAVSGRFLSSEAQPKEAQGACVPVSETIIKNRDKALFVILNDKGS